MLLWSVWEHNSRQPMHACMGRMAFIACFCFPFNCGQNILQKRSKGVSVPNPVALFEYCHVVHAVSWQGLVVVVAVYPMPLRSSSSSNTSTRMQMNIPWLKLSMHVWVRSNCTVGGCQSSSAGYTYSGNPFKWMPLHVRVWQDCCALCRLAQDCAAWTAEIVALGKEPMLHCWLWPHAGDQLISLSSNVSGEVQR
jgi:hypothetical protein